jgi:hypothetical protein
MAQSTQALWTSRSFLWLGLICAAFGLFLAVRRVIALVRWSAVDGQVVGSELKRTESVDGSVMYSALITIRWTAGEREVVKTFNQWGSASSESFYRKKVDRYPVGSNTEVRFDPAKPTDAFLEAGYTLGFFLFPLLFTVFGSAFAILGYFIGRKVT